MSEIIKLVILAFVQGIAEFLPISSSGHLEVISKALEEFAKLKLENGLDSLTVSVILHLGTLMSLLVAGILLHDFFEENLSNLWIIGCMFILTAILLIASQMYSRRKTESDESPSDSTQTIDSNGSTSAVVEELSAISWVQALVIGIFQMFAILPGLSRSGSTIAGGLFSGLKQSAAANFSFLMAIPVIGGAGILELLKLFKHHQTIPITELSIGFFVSFVVGVFALYWVINWIKKGKLTWFAYWLFFMAAFSFYLALL